MRPPSLLGAQTSGFVPFAAGGSVHGDLDEPVRPSPATSRVRVALPETIEAAPSRVAAEPASQTWRSAAWAPAASRRVRWVEAVVLAAIGGYFSLGLVKLAGGL
ncbi:MAG TPA: hypothetical protein VHM00_18250 [Caldimonas sp.]|nr:hypothetical protein [Caldimonas sp.]HEX2543009.1 hypothetical protein [Caldimonas sp.]